jgi:hypothetical protein
LDRRIVYPASIPLDTDFLFMEQRAMVALGYIAEMLGGTSGIVFDLACTPTSPASMVVNIGRGAITALAEVDATAFGSLGTDTAALVKMGINEAATPFTLTAPGTSGQSINYLIEAQMLEQDGTPIVLPYVNAANPSMPYAGPGNSGTAQNTVRAQSVGLQLKAGAAATTGTQTTPLVDGGWVGLYIITVNYGQTTVTSSSISVYPGAPFIGGGAVTLGRLINVQKFSGSGTYTPTPGTTECIAEVVGGGGSGGGAQATSAGQTSYGGGGGGGGYAKGRYPVATLTGLAVTVGAGGFISSGNGNPGNSSSIGSVISATGGGGGSVALANTPPAMAAGGASGIGSGGNILNSGGGPGGAGIALSVGNGQAGFGGGSALTGGVVGPYSNTAGGNAGFGPGCGSSGASSQNGGGTESSASAAAGIVIIYEYS